MVLTEPMGTTQIERIEAVLERIADLGTTQTAQLDAVTQRVDALRADRHKPYLTSMGMFFAVSAAVFSYVYTFEGRVTEAMFVGQERTLSMVAIAEANSSALTSIARRFEARTVSKNRYEQSHAERHNRLEVRMQEMAKMLARSIAAEKAYQREVEMSGNGQ